MIRPAKSPYVIGILFLILLLSVVAVSASAECSHVYTDWTILGDCRYRECTLCGASEQADIPVHTCTGRDWKITAARHSRVCTVCGAEVENAAHVFSDWVVTKEATVSETGEQKRTCSVCGYTETAIISCLTPTDTDESDTDTTEPDPPEAVTDDSPITETASENGTVSSDKSPSSDGNGTSDGNSTAGGSSASTVDTWDNPFIDISEKHPYYDAVRYVSTHNLFVGIETDAGLTFSPGETMTRAMFVTVLGRMAGIDVSVWQTVPDFTDVTAGAWYTPYAAWADKTGIVRGYDTGAFGVNDKITVEQAAVIIARYAKAAGLTVFDASYKNALFDDAEDVSAWAAADVGWCIYTGIYAPEDKIRPTADAQRGLAADMLYRYAVRFGGA